MKRLVKWAALVVFAVCAGCQMGAPRGGSPAAWGRILAGERVRVAVFVDRGARSNGQFRWLQTTALSDELAAFPIDAEMIRKGGLAQADLIIMPGGYSVTEAKTLGKDGREQGYEPILASADAGSRPDFAYVLVIAGPQYLESILHDIGGKNLDRHSFIRTRTPVLDAVENPLVNQIPTLHDEPFSSDSGVKAPPSDPVAPHPGPYPYVH